MTSILGMMAMRTDLRGGAWLIRQLRVALFMALACSASFTTRTGEAFATATAATADSCIYRNGIRLGDEIAVVDTRSLCGSCNPESLHKGLRFENYAVCDEAGDRRWQKSNLDEFLSFDPSVTTIFYVHGNQMTAGDAKCQGLQLYRKLVHYSGCEAQRIRFVIFSWPSARVGRLLYDVRVKAMRTGPAGCQLAWLLDQMPAETPVSLIGFSYGARIITGSLHILGGGTLSGGLGLQERVHPDRAPMNAVLIAAASHAHWLGKGRYHGRALTQVDYAFFLNSCRDLAMRYYRLSTTDRSRPQAMGLRGPTCLDAEYRAKVKNRDVSRHTGSEHDLFRYLCAPGATGQVWQYATTAPGGMPAVKPELTSTH